ncbi:MAG: hypothetical protein AAB914_01305 [Patescibacteria group bacterium]
MNILNNSKNYEEQAFLLANRIIVPGQEISQVAQQIGVKTLGMMELMNGDQEYHNAPHSIEFVEEALDIYQAIQAFVPEEYQEDMPTILFLTGLAHDLFNDEHESAKYIKRMILTYGDEKLKSSSVLSRIGAPIVGTTVEIQDNTVVQTHIGNGVSDPAIQISGWADINQIPRKGDGKMIKDALNLGAEINGGNPTTKQVVDMFKLQPKFLADLLDESIQIPNLEFYYPGKAHEVYDILRGMHKEATQSASNLAKVIDDNPDKVEAAVEHMFSVNNGAVLLGREGVKLVIDELKEN